LIHVKNRGQQFCYPVSHCRGPVLELCLLSMAMAMAKDEGDTADIPGPPTRHHFLVVNQPQSTTQTISTPRNRA
jgi:hypothetical protein